MYPTVASTNNTPPLRDTSVLRGDPGTARVVDQAPHRAVSLAVAPETPSAVVRLGDVKEKEVTYTPRVVLPTLISLGDSEQYEVHWQQVRCYVKNSNAHSVEESVGPYIALDYDKFVGTDRQGHVTYQAHFKAFVMDRDTHEKIYSIEGDDIDPSKTLGKLKGSFTDLKTGEKTGFTGTTVFDLADFASSKAEITTTSGEHYTICFGWPYYSPLQRLCHRQRYP